MLNKVNYKTFFLSKNSKLTLIILDHIDNFANHHDTPKIIPNNNGEGQNGQNIEKREIPKIKSLQYPPLSIMFILKLR